MKLMPYIYVSDLERSSRFYVLLGFTPGAVSRCGMWSELHLGDAFLALHAVRGDMPSDSERVQLALDVSEPLEVIAERLSAAGITTIEPIVDESFGRGMDVIDPDGLRVQFIEHDRDLYT